MSGRISRRARTAVAATIAVAAAGAVLVASEPSDASSTPSSVLDNACTQIDGILGHVTTINAGSRPHTWTSAGECGLLGAVPRWVIVAFASNTARDAWVHANWGGLGSNGTIREGTDWAAATWHLS